MSIFSKSLTQLSTADLQELLQEGAIENARLEFKAEAPAKDETLKKLSSFANTFGGFMVVGASALSSDGRITELCGVEIVNGYKQKIVDWCFSGATPPITAEVSDPISIPSGGARVCYVIKVQESDVAPHFLNGRRGVWIRTDEFSARFEARLADENEMRHLLDRRRLILERRNGLLERAQRRFDTYISQKSPQLQPDRRPARLDISVIPRFPSRPVSQQDDLQKLIVRSGMSWRQTKFPKLDVGIISQHESAVALQAIDDFTHNLSVFEVNIWGLLFYGTQLEQNERGTSGIHLNRVVGCVLLFLKHADTILKMMGYAGPILVNTALQSIRGVQWLHAPDGILISRSGSLLDNSVSFSISTTVEDLHSKPDGVAMDVLRYIFFSVDFPELVALPEALEELVRKGYKFNFWKEPSTLQT